METREIGLRQFQVRWKRSPPQCKAWIFTCGPTWISRCIRNFFHIRWGPKVVVIRRGLTGNTEIEYFEQEGVGAATLDFYITLVLCMYSTDFPSWMRSRKWWSGSPYHSISGWFWSPWLRWKVLGFRAAPKRRL